MPLFPVNSDEVLVNDPAFWLSRGEGLVSKTYAGVAGLDRYYAHHPPLYIFLQSWMIRTFGFNVTAVRSVSMFSYIGYIVLLMGILRMLHTHDLIGRKIFYIYSLAAATELISFSYARWGRNDMFALLLGTAGFVFIMGSSVRKNLSDPRDLHLWTGLLLISLSIFTHLEAIVFVIAAGTYLFVMTKSQFKWKAAIAFVVPVVIFTSLFFLIYGKHANNALIQLRTIAHYQLPAEQRSFHVMLSGLMTQNMRAFMQEGGTAFLWFSLSLIFLAMSCMVNIVREKGGFLKKRKLLIAFTAIQYINLILIVIVLGNSPPRYLITMPFSLLASGIAVSNLPLNWARGALMLSLFVFVIQIAGIVYYLTLTRKGWEYRSVNRYESFLARIPEGQPIAGYPALWFECLKSKRSFRAVDYGFVLSQKYWNENDHTAVFYYYVLPSNHPFVKTLGNAEKIYCEDFHEHDLCIFKL